MTDENNQLATARQDVQPSDIIAGLGLADRPLLATCLALFEDSTLPKRLEQLYSQSSDWVRKHLGRLNVNALQKWLDANVQEETASLRTQMTFWLQKCPLTSDNDLRLILWIYLA